MSAASRAANAKWRKKKLGDNAREFRAKEASRLRNYRAQAKEKQKYFLLTNVGEDSCVVQGADDVDACLCKTVCSSRTGHSKRASHFSSTHPTHSIEINPDVLTTLASQYARELLAKGQKTLREYHRRWEKMGTIVSHRAVDAFVSKGLVKVRSDSDRAREDIQDMIQNGREALFQLESIPFIDLRSIQVDEYQSFWIECIRVIEGLSQADAVLRQSL